MMRFEIVDRVAVLTLDRQERRNALNAEICDEIRAHFMSVAGLGGERANGVGAIVIAAEGSAFCAGADLVLRAADVSDGGGIQPGGNDSFRPAFERLLYCIVEHPLPVFAAINGPCMGAGMQTLRLGATLGCLAESNLLDPCIKTWDCALSRQHFTPESPRWSVYVTRPFACFAITKRR